jgi:hypothetical protein
MREGKKNILSLKTAKRQKNPSKLNVILFAFNRRVIIIQILNDKNQSSCQSWNKQSAINNQS